MASLERLLKPITKINTFLNNSGFESSIELEDNGKLSYSVVILNVKKGTKQSSFSFLTDSVKTIKKHHYGGKEFRVMIPNFRQELESHFETKLKFSIPKS